MTDSIAPNDFETMLRRALTPVEPPADFALRFEQTLQNLTDIAADELDAWELGAMRDAGDPFAYVEQTVKAVADEARRVLER